MVKQIVNILRSVCAQLQRTAKWRKLYTVNNGKRAIPECIASQLNKLFFPKNGKCVRIPGPNYRTNSCSYFMDVHILKYSSFSNTVDSR